LQNYTGDRLNFGLAAEQAKSEGYKIEVDEHITSFTTLVWLTMFSSACNLYLSTNCRWLLLEMIVLFPRLGG
jgi:hypothetical protein